MFPPDDQVSETRVSTTAVQAQQTRCCRTVLQATNSDSISEKVRAISVVWMAMRPPLGHHRMLASGGPQRRHDVPDFGAADIVHVQHLEAFLRRHDVAHQDISAFAAALGNYLHRLFAQDVGRGDQARDLAIMIQHQQQAYAALDHSLVCFVDAVGRADHDGTDTPQIRHDLDRGMIEGDAFRQGLGRTAKAGSRLQQAGWQGRICCAHHHGLLHAVAVGSGIRRLPQAPPCFRTL
jgi:hypothetical protein